MQQIQADYITFRWLLKSSYRKGVHTFRSILADNTQAKAFAENPAAIAVVLSYDKENPDGNAVELYNLLTASTVAETATLTYLCNTYGVTSFAELFANSEIMAEVLDDSTSMSAITASRTAMESIVADDQAAANLAASETALCAIAGSSLALEIALGNEVITAALEANAAAMNIVFSTETSRTVFLASDYAMSVLWETDAALGKYIAYAADLDYTAYVDFTALTSDEDAFATALSVQDSTAAMAGSAFALNKIAKTSTARTAWMNGSYAHTYYDILYETLHNAPTTLFKKVETYYSTYAQLASSTYAAYISSTGAWTSSAQDNKDTIPSEATTYSGIILCPSVYAYSGWKTRLWSTQTETSVWSTTGSTAETTTQGYALFGGAALSIYLNSSASSRSKMKYAAYIAV